MVEEIRQSTTDQERDLGNNDDHWDYMCVSRYTYKYRSMFYSKRIHVKSCIGLDWIFFVWHDMTEKSKTFQQAIVARLLELLSTRKWILSSIEERLILANVRLVEVGNDKAQDGVWDWDYEKDDVSFEIIIEFTAEIGLVV
jgi:hypothetical protein